RLGRPQPFRGRRGARSSAPGRARTQGRGGAVLAPARAPLLGRVGGVELGGPRRGPAGHQFNGGRAGGRARVSHASGDGWRLGLRALAVRWLCPALRADEENRTRERIPSPRPRSRLVVLVAE